MTSSWPTLRAAAVLSGIALLSLGLATAMYAWTREDIAAADRRVQLQALAIVLPAPMYDNDPLQDRIRVTADAWLGGRQELTVRRARRHGTPTALVVDAVAPDGYAGPIALLIGIDRHGRVTGVRITHHEETPGLGDAIEANKSRWIEGFRGRFLGSPPAAGWAVKRDGGDFDQFAGATLTPRAVVKAVRRALEFVRKHGDRLYAAPAGSALRFDDAPEPPLPDTTAPP